MDKEVHRRWLNNKRFAWHEAVLRDPVMRQVSSAVALAGHIMHKYRADKGCAQFSVGSAAKELGFDHRTIKRARKLLLERDWIKHDTRPPDPWLGRWRANRYILGGGPEDLLFEDDEGDAPDTGA